MSEIWKQIYLYAAVFDHTYRVWYFPFQVCSIPMYLCIIRYFLKKPGQKKMRDAMDIFLQDFGMLGGIAALLVPDGFTHPDHPLLTMHGYLWHVLLIIISVLVFAEHRGTAKEAADRKNAKSGTGEWIRTEIGRFALGEKLFLGLAVIAELINIVLHPYGDCDMFYISPYHLSSQPVFREIDRQIGRGCGIIVYLFAVITGAALIHLLYMAAEHISGMEKQKY